MPGVRSGRFGWLLLGLAGWLLYIYLGQGRREDRGQGREDKGEGGQGREDKGQGVREGVVYSSEREEDYSEGRKGRGEEDREVFEFTSMKVDMTDNDGRGDIDIITAVRDDQVDMEEVGDKGDKRKEAGGGGKKRGNVVDEGGESDEACMVEDPVTGGKVREHNM